MPFPASLDAPGQAQVLDFAGTPTTMLYRGNAPDGGVATVYIPRAHLTWGTQNCVIISPTWRCVRNGIFCNETASFILACDDGRGDSASASGFSVSDVCVINFVSGTTGSSGWVAGIGDVDGTNDEFTLIDWDGTGVVESSWNGLIQPNADLTLDTTLKTVV